VAPLLRAYAERLMPLVERLDDGSPDGCAWHKGYCPICGAWPVLGELRGVELAEYLRCGACGTGWRFRRLACAYCGNEDYRTLQTLTVDGNQRFRVSVCEHCHGYLKVGNAFDPLPAELVALDDLVSMHLDVVAIERGYQRPEGAGFTIELALPEQEWVEELA
jgi:FdhE protein